MPSRLLKHCFPTSVSRSLFHLVHIKMGDNKAKDQNIYFSYKVGAILGSEDSLDGLHFKETATAVFALAMSKIGTADQNKMNIS